MELTLEHLAMVFTIIAITSILFTVFYLRTTHSIRYFFLIPMILAQIIWFLHYRNKETVYMKYLSLYLIFVFVTVTIGKFYLESYQLDMLSIKTK